MGGASMRMNSANATTSLLSTHSGRKESELLTVGEKLVMSSGIQFR